MLIDGLQRFVVAQAPIYDQALAEIRAGKKRSHWMWFIFPQIAGLGRSAMAQQYAIRDEAEARAYLAHPLLGPRLRECGAAVLAVSGCSAEAIFGAVDAQKLRSCATLFAQVSPPGSPFHLLLDQYFGGQGDRQTLDRLRS